MLKRTVALLLTLLAFVLIPFSAIADKGNSQIQNGDFELGYGSGSLPNGWTYQAWFPDEGSGYADTASDESRGYCAHIVNLAENDARLIQTLDVEPNSYYRLTCFVRTKDVFGGAGANISIEGSLAKSDGVFGTSAWQQIELVGKSAKGQKTLTVCVRLGGYGALTTGEAWFDSFQLEGLDSYDGYAQDFSQAKVASSDDVAVGEVPYAGTILFAALLTAILFTIIYKRFISRIRPPEPIGGNRCGAKLVFILIAAFLLRCLLSLILYGHVTDINCFMAWSATLARDGFANFYTSGMFADYPPGYMYALWLVGSVNQLLGVAYGSSAYALIVKLPGILADLAAAYVIFKLAKKRFNLNISLVLAALVAFNPTMAFVSGAWGQIDQILTLLLLASILLFIDDRLILAGLIYGLAIIVKPQALMAGPLFAVAYFCKIHEGGLKALLRTVAAVGAALGVMYVLSLPFWGNQGPSYLADKLAESAASYFNAGDGLGTAFIALGALFFAIYYLVRATGAVGVVLGAAFLLSLPFWGNPDPFWLVDKLLGTATSYPYASIEAFNLFALVGGNWQNVTARFLGATYQAWGTAFIALSALYAAILYIVGRKREPHCLSLCMAFMIAAMFTLGHYMHERYLFPALLLLVISFIFYRDRRLFVAYAWLSASMLFNVLIAFMVSHYQESRGDLYSFITYAGSAVNVLGFVYLAYVTTSITLGKKRLKAFSDKPPADALVGLPPEHDDALGFTKRDRLFCFILTGVYALVALVNLGTTTAPETAWYGRVGESYVIELSEETEIGDIQLFGGLYTGTITVQTDDGTTLTYCEDNGDMFRWRSILEAPLTTKALTLKVTAGSVWFNELALLTEDGALIRPARAEGLEALFDEPEEVPSVPSYLNGMYFDELYHARTAYEHLHGIEPYENSHPPLGKIFIMLGIAVFGMNAFGWRIVGTLFGIAMVPLMYAFGKRMFKSSAYALVAAGLFAFDFMHFTQTRIATIDVYGVFFIIGMYYYMYRYYCMNFFSDGLKKTLKPLALSGVFFALGAASKWICIYAGIGLALILFTSLGSRYLEYRRFRDSADAGLKEKVRRFPSYAVRTLLWCFIFFVALPVVVYIASYIPYYFAGDAPYMFPNLFPGSGQFMHAEEPFDLRGVWGVQQFMFSYHSGLTATHPYQSSWWEWPVILRPIWYYVSYDVSPGNVSTISAMGNPAVWWVSTIGTIIAVIKLLRNKLRVSPAVYVLLIGICANYIPWVLVSRCTFIYHFFATVPFILLLTVYLLNEAEKRRPKLKPVKWIWLGSALVLFIMFYPVISGLQCPRGYVSFLEWLPGWTFIGS